MCVHCLKNIRECQYHCLHHSPRPRYELSNAAFIGDRRLLDSGVYQSAAFFRGNTVSRNVDIQGYIPIETLK